MSEMTTAIVGNHQFTSGGKTYNLKPLNHQVQADFERKMFGRARDLAKLIKEDDVKEYSRLMQRIQDDYMLGNFGFETAKGQELLKSPMGVITLIGLMCDVEKDEVLKLLSSPEKDEISSLVKTQIMDSLGITQTQVDEAIKRLNEE